MKYGAFDDRAREYRIDTPATPLPWINYLGNDGFFSLISNTGGGYSFYRDAKLRRITRYRYNQAGSDDGGRRYYIKENGEVWNPGFLPCRTKLDRYQCRHGLGYTVLEGEKNGLSAELTCFVPLGETCEVNRLVFHNHSNQAKTFKLFSAVEWCLWNAVDDAQNFQRNYNTGEVEVDGSVLYHKTEYRERRNHYAFYSVNAPISGFDTDRETFLGRFGGWDCPAAVADGNSRNSVASGWSPIASHCLNLTLAPGESKTILFVLGYCENPSEQKWERSGVINKAPARDLISRFSKPEQVQSALDALKSYWEKLLGRFQIHSKDEKLDRMVNIWNQYQCMVTFNLSRSASYFESGVGRSMGFRDSCQDLLGFVHLIPERARQRILDIASIQFEDGSTWHQYQVLTRRGNADVGTGFNDDPLWLVACTSAYLRETGDSSILLENVPFDSDETLAQPLMEHLRRSIQYTISHRGPHGLPLIGRADWNDCLNLNCFSDEPGESFQTCANFESGKAESVFIAAMFVQYGREYAEICRRWGTQKEAETVLQAVQDMEQSVLKYGWDGEWFLRAYDAFGGKVGSHECEEGKIYIEPQGFCVLAGIGKKEGYAKTALESVRKHLTTQYGTCLLAPCYTSYHRELGEISSYPPGYKENGGIFCHNNPWVSIAEAAAGDPEEAFAVYRRTCPAYVEEISDIHRTEPYVYSQMIAGAEASRFGEAKNSWLTGTAAWTFVNVSQYLLGIRPGFDGLEIHPCLPASMPGYQAVRLYRGTKYHITVKRTGTYSLCAEGKMLSGHILPLTDNANCEIIVTI